MKTMKQLLIVIGLLSVLSLSAQTLAQQPEVKMASTSVMAPCGSALPQAATTGAVLTGSTPGAYAPANAPGRRRALDEGDSGDKPSGWEDPMKDPLGDALLPLMLIALAYVGTRVFLKRKRA